MNKEESEQMPSTILLIDIQFEQSNDNKLKCCTLIRKENKYMENITYKVINTSKLQKW